MSLGTPLALQPVLVAVEEHLRRRVAATDPRGKTDCALSVYPSYTGVPATRLVLLRAAGTAAGRRGPAPQEADLLGEKGQSEGHLIGTRPNQGSGVWEMGVPEALRSPYGTGEGEACRLKAGFRSDSGASDVVFREGSTGGGRRFQGCGEVTGPRSVYLGCQWVKKSLNWS